MRRAGRRRRVILPLLAALTVGWRPAWPQPAAVAVAGEGGRSWSLELANAPLRAVLDQLAQACGMVLEYDQQAPLARRMSLSARGGDPDLALHYTLRAHGLALQPAALPPAQLPRGAQRAMRVVPGEALAEPGAVVIGTASLLVEVAPDEAAPVRRPALPATGMPTIGAAATAGATQQGAQLDWKIRPRTRVGSNFTVQIFVRADRPVASVPMSIAYDREALQVVRIEAGDFLGAQPHFSSHTDPGGTITLLAARSTASAAPDGAGQLAAITFRAARATDAAIIQVTSARVLDASGADIPAVIPFRHSMPVQP